MFTRLDYSSALEYSIIRRYTNIVYCIVLYLFYKYQFGFGKAYSTSHAIITLVEIVSKALDTGKYVVGVF